MQAFSHAKIWPTARLAIQATKHCLFRRAWQAGYLDASRLRAAISALYARKRHWCHGSGQREDRE